MGINFCSTMNKFSYGKEFLKKNIGMPKRHNRPAILYL